jgi:hypothetical protein
MIIYIYIGIYVFNDIAVYYSQWIYRLNTRVYHKYDYYYDTFGVYKHSNFALSLTMTYSYSFGPFCSLSLINDLVMICDWCCCCCCVCSCSNCVYCLMCPLNLRNVWACVSAVSLGEACVNCFHVIDNVWYCFYCGCSYWVVTVC